VAWIISLFTFCLHSRPGKLFRAVSRLGIPRTAAFMLQGGLLLLGWQHQCPLACSIGQDGIEESGIGIYGTCVRILVWSFDTIL